MCEASSSTTSVSGWTSRTRSFARAPWPNPGSSPGQLWAETEDVTRANPNSPSVALFVQAVNETIDIGAKRSIALATWQLPWTVWLSAYVLAFTGMVLVGFHNGVQGARNLLPTVLLALIFAVVMSLIVDLDRPYLGLLQVGQDALLEVQRQIGGP